MKLLCLLPESVLFISLLLFLITATANRTAPRFLQAAAVVLAGLGAVACAAALGRAGIFFGGAYRVDRFSQVVKILLAVGLLLVTTTCRRPWQVTARRESEFFFLLFTGTLAMMMLVSAMHLLGLYLTLELSSYSLYILVTLQRRERRTLWVEGGFKYFLIGAVSSVIMLLGMGLLYAGTGQTHLSQLARVLPQLLHRPLITAALVLVLGGFFFKLALFPFHLWAPDVYQAAPNSLAVYIATVSKVAAIGVLLRFATAAAVGNSRIAGLLALLAVVSMTIGNLAAIGQRNFSRLMAFSSIAHAGYVLIGILCLTPEAVAASLFYAASILVMKFTAFWVVIQATGGDGTSDLSALHGLHRRSPLLAMALMLSLFGLAGIPPTMGFTAKLLIFSAAVRQGYLALVGIAMVNVVISLYYYLSVIKAAYLADPGEDGRQQPPISPLKAAMTLLLVIVLIGAGIYPHPLLQWLIPASNTLFSPYF